MFLLKKKNKEIVDKSKTVCEMNQSEYRTYLRRRLYKAKDIIIEEPKIIEEEHHDS